MPNSINLLNLSLSSPRFVKINTKNVTKEVKVGLFTLLCGLLLYAGFNFLKSESILSTNNKYYLVFDQISGLQEGNSVRINGFQIGTVKDISLMPQDKNRILVTIIVSSKYDLPKNVEAFLADDGLLGEKFIEIRFPDQPATAFLASGDTLTGRIDQGILDQLKNKAEPLAVSAQHLLDSLNLLVQEFKGTGIYMQATLKNAAVITETLAQNRHNIDATFGNMRQLSTDLVQTQQQLGPLLKKMNNIADSVQNAELAATINETRKTLVTVNDLLTKINQGEGSLGKMVNDDELSNNLNKTILSLDTLLINFREHPKRYVHFSVFGKKDKESKK